MRDPGGRLSGLALILWAAVNTYVSIARYGLDQGLYWWFCNLALWGSGAAILARSRGCLIFILSAAAMTQPFWVLDNLWRLATGANLFGLVEYMYQPGHPMSEFVLGRYHYFAIPATVLAILRLSRGGSPALAWSMVWGPLILAVSYFVFPREQNINCAHAPCFPALEHWAGLPYAIRFAALWLVLNMTLAFALDRLFASPRLNERVVTIVRRAAVAALVAGLVVSAWDVWYKSGLPSFHCVDGSPSAGVDARCLYTTEGENHPDAPPAMSLAYQLTCTQAAARVCTSLLEHDGEELVLHTGVVVEPSTSRILHALVPYPARDVRAVLKVTCVEQEP